MNNEDKSIVEYKTDLGDVKLSPTIVKQYLVSGNANTISNQEIVMFMALCKYQKLNPFLKEVFCIKYSENTPATLVTAWQVFLKRASKNPKYQGHKAGVTEKDGKIISGWAEVYLKDYQVPIRCEVDFSEYAQYKDKEKGILNKVWGEKPKTMIRKVALSQALREAFPEDLSGLYTAEELGQQEQEKNPQQHHQDTIKLEDVIKDNPEPQKPMYELPPEKEIPPDTENFDNDIEYEKETEVEIPEVKSANITDSQKKLIDDLLKKIQKFDTFYTYLKLNMVTKDWFNKPYDNKITKEEGEKLIQYLMKILKEKIQKKG